VIPKAESKTRKRHERKPVSLLLLEDDPRFAELLSTRVRKMRLAGLRLEVAGTLAAALARLGAEPFDLVLSDLNLPDSSGLATLEALSRAGEQLIIVLTGDPNPALQGQITQNDIPLFETREFDSILRLQSGEAAVLAGLMQDQVDNTDTGIPGIRSIPIIGEALSSRASLTRKTELVIFLRATVIRDPSIDGDFASFRNQLPGEDFLSKPNPGLVAPIVGPGQPR